MEPAVEATEFVVTQPSDPDRPQPEPGSDDPSRWSTRDPFRDRYRLNGRRDNGAVVWGLILLAIGIWFFLDQTLGIQLPRIDWRYAWPVVLIVIGAVVVIQATRRGPG
jgi:uncharacterized integral membrane protein